MSRTPGTSPCFSSRRLSGLPRPFVADTSSRIRSTLEPIPRLNVPLLRCAALYACLFSPALLPAQARPLGTLREQAALQQAWLQTRLDSVLPPLMREHGVSMWIVPMREYNEDPVFWSIVSPTTMAARRRTIYVFCDRGPQRGVDRVAIGGSTQGGLYRVVRDANAQMGAAGAGRRLAEPFGPEQGALLPPLI